MLLVSGEGDVLHACSETSRLITELRIATENKTLAVKKEAVVSFFIAGAKPSILTSYFKTIFFPSETVSKQLEIYLPNNAF